MVKVKDLFCILCDDLGYRFFSGVAFKNLESLFKFMSPEFLHYVPAVNESVALGIVAGASLAGSKSCLVIDLNLKWNIYSNIDFAIENKIPFMIIGYGNKTDNIKGIPKVYLNNTDSVSKLEAKIVKESIPGLLIIGEDCIL
jgi:sulfopyruvate decarboxylase TPP-binding subunit